VEARRRNEQIGFPNPENASTDDAIQQLNLRGNMRKRGKVLRDPHAGPGLLMVEGRQYPFSLESVWKSEGPPKPGLAVDIDFGQSEQILAITVVPESELAKEKVEAAAITQKQRGWKFLDKLAAKCGLAR
jgi:hypothetical protein